jgi:hypothetical protein
MHSTDTVTEAAEIISATHRDIGGALPMAAHVLAIACGFELAPNGVLLPDAAAAVAAGRARALAWDTTQPPAVQARCIALQCARWLVERANKSPDAAMVEAVASGLCGGCKPLVRATAALLVTVAAG